MVSVGLLSIDFVIVEHSSAQSFAKADQIRSPCLEYNTSSRSHCKLDNFS